MLMEGLKDRVAVITVAGADIGAAVARNLDEAGMRLNAGVIEVGLTHSAYCPRILLPDRS